MNILSDQLFKRLLVVATSFAISMSPATGFAQVPDLVPVPMQGGGTTSLPNIGGESGGLTWVEERELGDFIAGLLQQDAVYEQDPLLHGYVADLWQRLLSAAQRDGELSADLRERMAWELYLIRDPSVNAFALPGAYVGVNLGLISAVQSRDELASVLAHESVHIFQRHIARSYAQSKDLSAISLVSAVLGIIAMGIDPNLGGAIIMGGGAAAVQGQIDFTRAMEHEADRIGYKVLVDAGFRPEGMSEMFGRLAEASRFSDTTSFPYLRTHPLTSTRIAEAQTRLGVDVKSQSVAKDTLQNLMSARAAVLSKTKQDNLRLFVSSAYDAKTKEVREAESERVLYAGALAAAKLKQYDVANRIYTVLSHKINAGAGTEEQQAVALLGGEIALAGGQVEQAQERFAQVDVSSIPFLQRSAVFLKAQIALESKDNARTIALLEPWVRDKANDAYAWGLLAQAYRQSQQVVQSLRAEAEVRMVMGDYDGAIDRFRASLNQATRGNISVYDLEVIQTRLKVAQQAQADRQKLLRQ